MGLLWRPFRSLIYLENYPKYELYAQKRETQNRNLGLPGKITTAFSFVF